MMWWAIWCVAVVACGAGAAAAPGPDSLAPYDLAQIDPPAPDDEGVGYGVAQMSGRYASAPWVYLLAEVPHDSQVPSGSIPMPSRRSFSVNPPVEVLQQGAHNRYIERLQHLNRDFLDCIGKRGQTNPADCTLRN